MDKSKLDQLIQILSRRLGISRQEVVERFPFLRDFDVADFGSLDLEEFALEIEAEFGEGAINRFGNEEDQYQRAISSTSGLVQHKAKELGVCPAKRPTLGRIQTASRQPIWRTQ